MKSMDSNSNSTFGPHYFHPDEVDEGRKIMTEWVKQVYDAVKRSGSERELAISIPIKCRDLSVPWFGSTGMDAARHRRCSHRPSTFKT